VDDEAYKLFNINKILKLLKLYGNKNLALVINSYNYPKILAVMKKN
jgi:hypothetical protein